MAFVNLMPWRQRRLRQRWRVWRLLGLALLMSLALGLLIGFWQHGLNQQQIKMREAWPVAQKEAAALYDRTLAAHQQLERQQQAQRRRLQQREALIRWADTVRLLETELPSDVWLRSLKKNQQGLVLQGLSRSISGIYQVQGRLRRSSGIEDATLGALRRDASGNISFNLHLRLGEDGRHRE